MTIVYNDDWLNPDYTGNLFFIATIHLFVLLLTRRFVSTIQKKLELNASLELEQEDLLK